MLAFLLPPPVLFFMLCVQASTISSPRHLSGDENESLF